MSANFNYNRTSASDHGQMAGPRPAGDAPRTSAYVCSRVALRNSAIRCEANRGGVGGTG